VRHAHAAGIDVTGVTGLKILRAIVAGERDPGVLAALRDRRCKCAEAEIAEALEGRYRPEFVSVLRHCLSLWEKYGEIVAELDREIAARAREEAARAREEAARPRLRRADGAVLHPRGRPYGDRGGSTR